MNAPATFTVSLQIVDGNKTINSEFLVAPYLIEHEDYAIIWELYRHMKRLYGVRYTFKNVSQLVRDGKDIKYLIDDEDFLMMDAES